MKKVSQETQTVHNPITGKTMIARTYSGKELFLKKGSDEQNEEYAKRWEDDRI